MQLAMGSIPPSPYLWPPRHHHFLHSPNIYMGGLLKWGFLQIIHFNGILTYKPSILAYPHCWNPPLCFLLVACLVHLHFLTLHPQIKQSTSLNADCWLYSPIESLCSSLCFLFISHFLLILVCPFFAPSKAHSTGGIHLKISSGEWTSCIPCSAIHFNNFLCAKHFLQFSGQWQFLLPLPLHDFYSYVSLLPSVYPVEHF